jgi:hypothetical protein
VCLVYCGCAERGEGLKTTACRYGSELRVERIDRFLDSIVALEWLYILHPSFLSSAFDGGLDLRVQSRQPDFYKQELRS